MLFNIEVPINNLSFGNVGVNILNEIYKLGLAPNLFPIGNPDLSVFDKLGPDFHQFVGNCINKASKNFKKDMPYLKLWHCSQSWHKISEPSYLINFHELDNLTDTEVNIYNSYKKIFVTSNYSKKVFENNGVNCPIEYIKLGVDSLHFKPTNKKYLYDGSIIFFLGGKCEKRKGHAKVIKSWVKKYGNNKKYRLHLHIHNHFIQPSEKMNEIYAQLFDNKPLPSNVTIFSFQGNNSLYNDAINCSNIIIDMSGGESLSLPLLNGMAMGKWAVVHNNTAMLDYCNDSNSVLVQPNGKIPCYDGMFFHPNQPFNQGNIFDFDEEEFLVACDKAIERFQSNPINTEGLKLKDSHNYTVGVNQILKSMEIL